MVRPLVHRQSLHLMEDRGVGGVEFVGAEGAADRDDVDRQFALQQRPDLHRRGVGAQHLPRPVGRDVEGVLLAARRMVGREVQRVEVELLGLDLGSFGQLPAHRDERVGDVLGQDGDRVAGADGLPGRRQRHVDALGDQHCGVALGAQHGEPLVVGLLRLGARDVDPLARVGAVGLGQRPQRLAGQRDRRAVAEVLGLGAGQRVEVAGQVEGVAGRADGFGQRFVGQVDGLISHPAIIGEWPRHSSPTWSAPTSSGVVSSTAVRRSSRDSAPGGCPVAVFQPVHHDNRPARRSWLGREHLPAKPFGLDAERVEVLFGDTAPGVAWDTTSPPLVARSITRAAMLTSMPSQSEPMRCGRPVWMPTRIRGV